MIAYKALIDAIKSGAKRSGPPDPAGIAAGVFTVGSAMPFEVVETLPMMREAGRGCVQRP